MSERPGGFERRDIDQGFQALAGAQSQAELKSRIDSMPVLRSPIFHAYLRQYRLSNLQEFEKNLEAYRGFMGVYDLFFTLLHHRAYFQQMKPGGAGDFAPPPAEPFAPSFFLEAARSLGAQLPLLKGPTGNPETDAGLIQNELAEVLSKPVLLPEYQPVAGSRWGAVLVSCGSCRQMRVTVRAHQLDLLRAPELLATLEQGRINGEVCPKCGSPYCVPLRVWIQEQPAPFDALAAISCICRVRENESIYLPPPGTVRDAEYDRILEIRMEQLIRQLSPDPLRPEMHGTGVETNGIAYSLEELVWRIHQTSHAAPGAAEYQDILEDVYQKVKSGLLSYQEAERQVRQMVPHVGKEWPLIAAEPAGDLVRALVTNLILEACAEARALPFAFRASRAGVVAQCYTGLGEIGLAQANLARGRDLLAQETDGEKRAAASLALINVEADLLSAQGKAKEAEALRRRVLEATEPAPETPQGRLTRRLVLMNQALELRNSGRMTEAIERIRADIAEFEALARELRGTHPGSAEALSARGGMSGSLANLAGTYSLCAGYLDLLAFAARGSREAIPPRLAALLHQLGSPQALLEMQRELYERVLPLLEPEFGECTPAALRERAEALLRQAIAIARELGHFEYLSIQSHSLGLLLDEMDRPAEAEDAMAQCLKYGARIGDYRHMSRASMFLASAKLGRGDGKAALAELKNTLRFDMRDTVRRGTLETSMAPRIAANALSCAAAGGDVCTAVLVAESAKALPLAISLMRGVPLQAAAAAGDASRGSAVEGLFRRREELRLKAMWEPDSAAEIESQLEQVDAELTGARQEAALRDVRYARWHDATYLEVTEPATARRILGETGARATLAGFLVHGSSIYTYALWSDGEMAERLPLPRELASIKEDAGMALDPAVMAALAQVFLEPLAGRLEKLEPRDRLILSPSAPLDRLPFGMLRFRNRYLCEVATLSAVDGIGMLEGCAARPAAPVREAVCIGAPPRPDVPDLSYAARELERVTEVLEKAGVKARPALNGRAATIGALAARIGSCDVAHFACHALAPGAGHAEAQLLLAPDLLSKDSGVLSEDRILFHLALKPGCHINLAGCRTGAAGGAGRFFPHGLVPAFLVAGARSVLASLWPLEDEPASRFQSLYYEELISGRTPADALAATQRACIQGNAGEPLRQPGGWAPYLLHGLG